MKIKMIEIYEEDLKELQKMKIDLSHKRIADTLHYLLLEVKGEVYDN